MRASLLFTIALITVGCGAGSGGAPDGAQAAGDMAVASLDDLATEAEDLTPAGPCGGDKHPPDGGVCLLSVTGRVVDEKGAGLPDVQVTVCGPICYYGIVGADGSFAVKLGLHVVPDRWATEIHGRPDHVSYYVPLPPIGDGKVRYPDPFVVPALPAMGPEIALGQSKQTLASGDVTLDLAKDTKVMLDAEDVVAGPSGRQFRTVTIPDPKTMPFVDPMDPPLALFGVAPFEATFAPGAQLAFNNTTGLAAGAAVDVFVQVGLNEPGAAGSWNKTATAHVVSMNGTTRIAMDPGQAITETRFIALRKGP